jgi:2C-methyl-D-erythritol 2,4-cyclodiphosphate synthase
MLVMFDTQEAVNKLKANGFTNEQADAVIEIQKQIIHDAMDTTLATKGNINEFRNDVNTNFNKVDTSFTEVRSDIKSLETRLSIMEKAQWIIIAGILALVFKSFIG